MRLSQNEITAREQIAEAFPGASGDGRELVLSLVRRLDALEGGAPAEKPKSPRKSKAK